VRLRARDWAWAAAALACAALFVRLGIWQVHRLEQRRRRNDATAARRALAPILLGRGGVGAMAGGGSLTLDSVQDRRVVARGTYDYSAERLWTGRTYEGTPGVAVLTPLRLADGGGEGRGGARAAVYVDRGWVPSPDGVHIDQQAVREGDTATVEGLAFAAPRARGDVDIARLRDSVSYPLLPFIIEQTRALRASATPTVRPPYRWPAPVLGDGPHLSYAIQWFSFAVITLLGTASLLRKIASESSRPTI
jgi:surfeit locus 1 family protein